MTTSSTMARSRRWYSLLTDRWHASSRVAMVMALLVLIFCNLPGQSVTRMEYEIGFPPYADSQFEHGWPLTYLIRTDEGGETSRIYLYGRPPKSVLRDCFELWRDCEEFRPWLLAVNGCIVLLASFTTGVVFEAWRRRRSRLWHLHLRDCFAGVFAMSLAAAWYAYAQRQQAVEAAAVNDGSLYVRANQAGGITWLRHCLGDAPFRCFDRPFAVDVYKQNGWSRLEALTTVHLVEAKAPGTTAQLAALAKLSRLEGLSLDSALFDETPDHTIAELPSLPDLRGLYLSQPEHRCRRLDRLTSLESLRITEGCIDEQALREIGRLPNLREVELDGLSASADLSFLPSRPRLTALDLYNGDISAAALENIGKCSGLKDLDFKMCRLDCSGVRHLAGLANLQRLNLEYTDVTDRDLAELANLKQLRELDLCDTKVGGDLHFMTSLENLESLDLYGVEVDRLDFESLRQMKQLRRLKIFHCSKDDVQALQEALPDCSIVDL